MEYGKFATAEELLRGYNELEKSFTQKCQELAAIKQNIESQQQGDSGTSGQPSPQEHCAEHCVDTATVPDCESADSSCNASVDAPVTVPPRVMTGGGNVSMALPNRPKTLREASELAKKYFN